MSLPWLILLLVFCAAAFPTEQHSQAVLEKAPFKEEPETGNVGWYDPRPLGGRQLDVSIGILAVLVHWLNRMVLVHNRGPGGTAEHYYIRPLGSLYTYR